MFDHAWIPISIGMTVTRGLLLKDARSPLRKGGEGDFRPVMLDHAWIPISIGMTGTRLGDAVAGLGGPGLYTAAEGQAAHGHYHGL